MPELLLFMMRAKLALYDTPIPEDVLVKVATAITNLDQSDG
jgi:hypothetical protein